MLSDGVRLVPYMTSLLQRQREQEQRDTRSNIGDLIEGVVNRAVHTFEDPNTDANGQHDDRHIGNQPRSSMNPYEAYSDSKKPLSPKDKGKGKSTDTISVKDPLNGRKIWLHCSVGEPGSLQEEEEAATEQQQLQQQVFSNTQ